MKQRSLIWSKLASTFVIAIAAGVTWAIVGFWGAYLITQLRESRPTIYERINVADNGTPVIDSQSVQQLQLDERSFRTLDGKPFFVKGRNWLSAAYFGKRLRPPAVFDFPISWRNRVVGLSDVQHPQTSWYFVRDAKSLGHAYFVGYDERAKLGVGWIGRNGFRRTIPPEDERFDVGLRSLDMNSGEIVSGAYYITP
ncbi:MAG TPA: hypothetical protein VH107_05695, partial [Lacipirellulaceae bacterium]|nr:hypothetical protein [Lacipirellulaceae bacterium]